MNNLSNKNQFNPGLLGIFLNLSYFTRRNLHKYFKKNSHKLTGSIMDFGAGESPYKHLLNYTKYVTLDVEKSGHDNTKNDIQHFYDGKTIPFSNETFDSIISTEVFEHIFNIDKILTELHRVLKKGGLIYITIPFIWEEHEIPYDFARYTQYGIIHLLQKNGFKIENVEKSGNYVEVIFQLLVCYISSLFPKTNSTLIKWIFIPLRTVIIPSLILLGIIFSKLLPVNKKIYLNTIILASK